MNTCCDRCQKRLIIKNKIIDRLGDFYIITQLKLVTNEVLELVDEESKLMLQTFLKKDNEFE